MVKEKKKLVWLGIKRASQTQSGAEGDIERIRENVGDYDTFQDDLDNTSSESEFKSYLQDDADFTEEEADEFLTKVNNNFTDEDGSGTSFDEFKSFVQDESDSYSELKSAFSSQTTFGTELETEDGQQAAGVRTFENDGVTYNGVSVPAGSVEVFGQEVHFSQSNSTKTGSGSGSSGGGSVFTVDNFQTDDSDDVVDIYQTLKFSADVTNNGDYSEYFVGVLTEDGDSIDTTNIRLGPGQTRNIEFDVRKTEYFCGEYKINTAGPITACWVPTGLIR